MNILCVPPKTLNATQKKAMEKKGLVIIETNNPDKVKIVNTETPIEVNDYFLSALFAMTLKYPSTKADHFVNNLYERLSKKLKAQGSDTTEV